MSDRTAHGNVHIERCNSTECPCFTDGAAVLASPWRVGRKVGRTIYAQAGPEPSDADVLIGIMDTPELAVEAVKARAALASLSEEDLRTAAECVRYAARNSSLHSALAARLEAAADALAALEATDGTE